MKKPIKRNEALQPLSRDHHHTLLLCWKIRAGFEKGIPVERIKAYADWFYENYIIKHFKMEEEYLYPILGIENKLIQQAIEEHKLLARLFTDNSKIEESLRQIPEELKKHIRFEERTLFNEIQISASPEQLEKVELIHDKEKFVDNLSDEFWLYKVTGN
ncbi:MAG: hemerythrin domain-containing protein [Ignavibacteria bacterium]|jgi:hemerythrin-like domain-containing protein|nr:hemerythrin domain-containing protein [Ignavibacteria bacterium]